MIGFMLLLLIETMILLFGALRRIGSFSVMKDATRIPYLLLLSDLDFLFMIFFSITTI